MSDDHPAPRLFERAVLPLRFTLGVALFGARHVTRCIGLRRSETAGGSADLPGPWPTALLDPRTKDLGDGRGPLLHRVFTVRILEPDTDAPGLIERLASDLDRAAPEAVTFRKLRGRVGGMDRGDEYVVKMPATHDGPVRVLSRTPTSFRFGTLTRHLEAGQIEFSARPDGPEALMFTVEAWSRAGDWLADLQYNYLRFAKEAQLAMWVDFCLGVTRLARGRPDGPVGADTRRVEAAIVPG